MACYKVKKLKHITMQIQAEVFGAVMVRMLTINL